MSEEPEDQETLRDTLAMHASESDVQFYQCWMNPPSGPRYSKYTRTEARYLFADAMLKARKKELNKMSEEKLKEVYDRLFKADRRIEIEAISVILDEIDEKVVAMSGDKLLFICGYETYKSLHTAFGYPSLEELKNLAPICAETKNKNTNKTQTKQNNE